MAQRRGCCTGLAALVAAGLFGAAHARAESDLALPLPEPLGSFRGVIHDRDGHPIGENVVLYRMLDDGHLRLRSEARIAGSPGNLLEAELEPIPGSERRFRPLWQHTRMPTGAGNEVMELHVDHRARLARCESDRAAPRAIPLDDRERIANVPMNLALRPLAAGNVEAVHFQMLLCEGWKAVVDVEARVQERAGDAPVEMRLGFDVGSRIVSRLLAPLLPEVRVWMRPRPPNEWIAHRLPLHRGGPIIAIVRAGLDPTPYLPAR